MRNHLRRNLRRLRLQRGLTQRELGALAKTASVPVIESGMRTNPGYAMLRRIADALGVSVDHLYGGRT